MKKVDLNELHKQLLARIDTEDLQEVKKIQDLMQLHKLDAKIDEVLERDKPEVVIKNGSQEFTKSHPLLNDKMKINAQKIALEKSIKFKLKTSPAPTSSTVEDKSKRGSLI
ncbi:MAG: terminase [Niallia sp.]